MQDSEFVDEYMLIYEYYMDHEITAEERSNLEEQLIQLAEQRMNTLSIKLINEKEQWSMVPSLSSTRLG
ncbi:hypothetical protein EHS13_31625 [Paenibacillus psychroresistens]|uniref:Uncharacterized protein n=1 Tax=Paenibacillus psychroresistens TaxID=1778678 RepID=A0A6B8RT77_9BACL|nr:hypothetical protein [Paenibacillus psychroresistens]QGQ99107.1 hypothetical protein EHS13_31625 [Paenibacillus psychroresistens]